MATAKPKYQIWEIDVMTGTETLRDMTPEEIANLEVTDAATNTPGQ